MEILLVVGLISWVVLATIVGAVSNERGSGFAVGFFLSLIFSPLIGLLVTIALGMKPAIKSPSSVSNAATDGGLGTPSAAAWLETQQSLDADDYSDFVEAFRGTPEALLALKHRRLLERWASLDKSDGEAIKAFASQGLFQRLSEHVRVVVKDGAATSASLETYLAELQKVEADQQQDEQARVQARIKEIEAADRAEQERVKAEKATDKAVMLWGVVIIVAVLAVMALVIVNMVIARANAV